MNELLQLTSEQRQLIPRFRQQCLKIALSTEPADRGAAEAGVELAYREAGLEPPATVVWTGSPLAAATTAAHLRLVEAKALGRPDVKDGVWDALLEVFASTGSRVEGGVGDPVTRAIWADRNRVASDVKANVAWSSISLVNGLLNDRVGDGIKSDLRDRVWKRASARLRLPKGEALPKQILDVIWSYYFGGQFNARGLVWLAYFQEIGVLDHAPANSGIWQAARSCGGWWPFERLVILSERPRRIELDDRQLPHSENGAAIEYPDGTAFHRWHGVTVEPGFRLDVNSMTAEAIAATRSSVLKEAMIIEFGHERYLQELGAVLVHEDEDGALYHRNTASSNQPTLMVEIFSGTWPDGSPRRLDLLQGIDLPPHLRSAREAREWAYAPKEGESDERWRRMLAEEVERAEEAGEALPPPGEENRLIARRWQRKREQQDRLNLEGIEATLRLPPP